MLLDYDADVPHIIKYMGSKRQILDFVVSAIGKCYQRGGTVCDLFAGSAVIAGALRTCVPVLSNDIQEYSSILANVYLSDFDWYKYPDASELVAQAEERVIEFRRSFPNLDFEYGTALSLEEFISIEEAQKQLIHLNFSGLAYHLFTKYYSGTYWSFEQCLWIDALREIADQYQETPLYYAILASLMFAMSYNSQSTGHYAQYRDATSSSSMSDILIYRKKQIAPYFIRKFNNLREHLGPVKIQHRVQALDYLECLKTLAPNTTVYADPPYCFVHYSRFYHAMETLVRYDYPTVEHKGRYRNDRHQSLFCIQTKVAPAFREMFIACREQNASLVLSYSNTGMIALSDLMDLVNEEFGAGYRFEIKTQGHLHSTMGRKVDKNRKVEEYIILAERKAQ